MNKKVINLSFVLDVDDDWPPVSIESIPCKVVDDGYQVQAAPLFVKNISVDDVIEVNLDSFGYVDSWNCIKQSENSTIWILRLAEENRIESTLENLRGLGCNTVRLPQYGIYSVDVPGNVGIAEIDKCLAELDPECVAIAYPSFRHE